MHYLEISWFVKSEAAPDLVGNEGSAATLIGGQPDKSNGHADAAATAAHVGRKERGSPSTPAVKAVAELAAEQLAAILDRLLCELAVISSADAAANWALEGIRAKNALTAGDAKRVEEAFAANLRNSRPGQGRAQLLESVRDLSRALFAP